MLHVSRKVWVGGLVGLVVIALVVSVLLGIRPTSAEGQSQASDQHHAERVVSTYLSALDNAMASPSCDMSSLASKFTPNATVTLTGGPFAPGGPFGAGNAFGAQQVHGTQAIIGMYTKICHILYSKNAGAPSWTQDQGYQLAASVINSYERISLGGHLVGRCMHVFVVDGNRIASLDWSVYA